MGQSNRRCRPSHAQKVTGTPTPRRVLYTGVHHDTLSAPNHLCLTICVRHRWLVDPTEPRRSGRRSSDMAPAAVRDCQPVNQKPGFGRGTSRKPNYPYPPAMQRLTISSICCSAAGVSSPAPRLPGSPLRSLLSATKSSNAMPLVPEISA